MKCWSKFSSITALSAHAVIVVHTCYTLCRPWKCVCKGMAFHVCTHPHIRLYLTLYLKNVIILQIIIMILKYFLKMFCFIEKEWKYWTCRGGAVKMNNQWSNNQTSLIQVLDIILGLWSYRTCDGLVWHLLDRLPVSCDIYF